MYKLNFRRIPHVRVYFLSKNCHTKTLYKSLCPCYNKIREKPFDFYQKRVNMSIWKLWNWKLWIQTFFPSCLCVARWRSGRYYGAFVSVWYDHFFWSRTENDLNRHRPRVQRRRSFGVYSHAKTDRERRNYHHRPLHRGLRSTDQASLPTLRGRHSRYL